MEDYDELIRQVIEVDYDNDPDPENTPQMNNTTKTSETALNWVVAEVLYAHDCQGTYLKPQKVSRTTLRKTS